MHASLSRSNPERPNTPRPYHPVMKMSTILATIIVLASVVMTGCGAEANPSEDTAAPNMTASDPAPAVQNSSCIATPTGDVGLTRVEVADTRVTWQTNTPIPSDGVVVFTVRDNATMRGLKFLDGAVIANYIFDVASAQQQESSQAPTVTGSRYDVVMPLGYVIDDNWIADLEIDTPTGMEFTGVCIPS